MSTPAGFAGFVNARINELFKNILIDYGKFLESPESRNVLDDSPSGWFSPQALEVMIDFDKTFICDPQAPYRGFTSFDHFFTRKFKEGARPIGDPYNDNVIVNACENAPYRIAKNVKRYEAFWIKSQPYSLQYILNNDERLHRFVGGTIYQGFLNAPFYHRFHAPVSGKILRKDVVPGHFFSQPYQSDGYMTSQPYLAHVATRGIIIIEADNRDLGLVAFLPIGMLEVSSIDLSPLKDVDYVTKGQDIGTFRFGGSSHILIFEKGKEIDFDLQGTTPYPLGKTFLHVRSKLGTLVVK